MIYLPAALAQNPINLLNLVLTMANEGYSEAINNLSTCCRIYALSLLHGNSNDSF